MLFHTARRLYLPASLLSIGLLILIWIASFTPLSNHFNSTSKILTLSKLMLWSGWSQFICFKTSEFTELGLLCSMNLAFRDLPVSTMYKSSQLSQLMWYARQITLYPYITCHTPFQLSFLENTLLDNRINIIGMI